MDKISLLQHHLQRSVYFLNTDTAPSFYSKAFICILKTVNISKIECIFHTSRLIQGNILFAGWVMVLFRYKAKT